MSSPLRSLALSLLLACPAAAAVMEGGAPLHNCTHGDYTVVRSLGNGELGESVLNAALTAPDESWELEGQVPAEWFTPFPDQTALTLGLPAGVEGAAPSGNATFFILDEGKRKLAWLFYRVAADGPGGALVGHLDLLDLGAEEPVKLDFIEVDPQNRPGELGLAWVSRTAGPEHYLEEEWDWPGEEGLVTTVLAPGRATGEDVSPDAAARAPEQTEGAGF